MNAAALCPEKKGRIAPTIHPFSLGGAGLAAGFDQYGKDVIPKPPILIRRISQVPFNGLTQ